MQLMTTQRAASPITEAEFLDWSRRWEAARTRAGMVPCALVAAGVLGGIALQTTGLRDLLPPSVWPIHAGAVLTFAGVILSVWLLHRNHDRVLASLGRMCGDCEHVIRDSRAVVRNGGRCPGCGAELYAPAA